MSKTIALLSGGIDSTVALAEEVARGESEVLAMTVSYGQRQIREVAAARLIAEHYDAPWRHVEIDLSWATAHLAEPASCRTLEELREAKTSPSYVPARNTLLVSLALAYSDVIGASKIILSANAGDGHAFPDCRPEFFASMNRVAQTGTTSKPSIGAPYLHESKSTVVRRGRRLGVPFEMTVSCYSGRTDDLACGRCDACILRREAFAKAGFEDPLSYVEDL